MHKTDKVLQDRDIHIAKVIENILFQITPLIKYSAQQGVCINLFYNSVPESIQNTEYSLNVVFDPMVIQ